MNNLNNNSFLQTCIDNLNIPSMSSQQRLLLLQYIAQNNLLSKNVPIKDDDWPWIALGLFLKTTYETDSNNRNVE